MQMLKGSRKAKGEVASQAAMSSGGERNTLQANTKETCPGSSAPMLCMMRSGTVSVLLCWPQACRSSSAGAPSCSHSGVLSHLQRRQEAVNKGDQPSRHVCNGIFFC